MTDAAPETSLAAPALSEPATLTEWQQPLSAVAGQGPNYTARRGTMARRWDISQPQLANHSCCAKHAPTEVRDQQLGMEGQSIRCLVYSSG